MSGDVFLGVCGMTFYSWALDFHWLGILHGTLCPNLALPFCFSPMLNKNGSMVFFLKRAVICDNDCHVES